jgi:hypothetical protein
MKNKWWTTSGKTSGTAAATSLYNLLKSVHGTRTEFEQLSLQAQLFNTVQPRSSALTPRCAFAKPMKLHRFFSLSTVHPPLQQQQQFK